MLRAVIVLAIGLAVTLVFAVMGTAGATEWLVCDTLGMDWFTICE